MIPLAAVLLLGAVGLLAVGVNQGSPALEWASFAASALAVVVLVVGEVRRRQRRVPVVPDQPRHVEPVAAEPPSVPPAPPVAAPPPPVPPARDLRPPRVPGPQTGRHGVPDPEPDVRPLAAPPPVPPPVPPVHRVPDRQPVERQPVDPQPVDRRPGEPPAEEVEFTDLLVIMDLTAEVLVVDEHPRYHLAGCPHVAGLDTIPVRRDQARADGFTPCGTCSPDRTLAARERARRG